MSTLIALLMAVVSSLLAPFVPVAPLAPATGQVVVTDLEHQREEAREEREKERRREARQQAREEALREARQEEKERREAQRQAARAARREQARNPQVLAPFRLGTFNALGDSHTAPGGNRARAGWADSRIRTAWATQLFNAHGLHVVALQEFQGPQQAAMRRVAPRWAFAGNADNYVAWHTDRFELVSTATVTIPYFSGNPRHMPVVRLRDKSTGQEMVFISVHNPADTRGKAEHWRNEATRRELATVLTLREERPAPPVFLLGDTNDRADTFCPVTASGDMHAAAGGSNVDGMCQMPAFAGIDWIFGTTGVEFSEFFVDRGPLVSKSSDHPLVATTVGGTESP